MRRRALTLLVMIVTFVLVAVPAIATEGATSEAEPSLWDGLILALILGSVTGVGVFLDAFIGDRSAGSTSHDH